MPGKKFRNGVPARSASKISLHIVNPNYKLRKTMLRLLTLLIEKKRKEERSFVKKPTRLFNLLELTNRNMHASSQGCVRLEKHGELAGNDFVVFTNTSLNSRNLPP
jgi:hypothetical protein